MSVYDPACAPTQVIARPRRRRKRWYQRWLIRIPALLLAGVIGITALGAAVGPQPLKATGFKTSAAALYDRTPTTHQETS